jgi:hypothetical protein
LNMTQIKTKLGILAKETRLGTFSSILNRLFRRVYQGKAVPEFAVSGTNVNSKLAPAYQSWPRITNAKIEEEVRRAKAQLESRRWYMGTVR